MSRKKGRSNRLVRADKGHALTDEQLNTAKTALFKLRNQIITATVNFDHPIEKLIEWIVPPRYLQLLTEVGLFAYIPDASPPYPAILNVDEFGDAIPSAEIRTMSQLNIRWKKFGILPPAAVDVINDRAAPLRDTVSQARRVMDEFSNAFAVLRWMNLRTTKAVIRYYWPPVASLLPNVFVGVNPVPRDLPGVGQWLEILRTSAVTMAAARLLPPDSPECKESRGAWVTMVAGGEEPDFNLFL